MSKIQIERRPVKSSNVHSVGYHPESQTLEVAFKAKDGSVSSVYHYHGVSAEKHAALLAADADDKTSLGSHFSKHIKPHKFTKL